MKELVFDNGIKKIAINDLDGELITVLRINVADGSTITRFSNVIDRIDRLSEEAGKKQNELLEKYKDVGEDEISNDDLNEVNEFKKEYLERLADEIDMVFGKGTVRNVFHEGYELYGEEFYPDEECLIDLVDSLIPVMNDLFNDRFKALKKKYNPGRKSKKK